MKRLLLGASLAALLQLGAWSEVAIQDVEVQPSAMLLTMTHDSRCTQPESVVLQMRESADGPWRSVHTWSVASPLPKGPLILSYPRPNAAGDDGAFTAGYCELRAFVHGPNGAILHTWQKRIRP